MTPRSHRSLFLKQVPLLAMLSSLALFVAIVPSRPAVVSSSGASGSDFELPDGVAFDGGADVDGATPVVDGTSDTTTGRGGPGSTVPGRPGVSGGPGVTGSDGSDPTKPGVGDCSRRTVTLHPQCRPPAFTGKNNGAGANGVTPDEVRVVVYQPKRNLQQSSIEAATGQPSPAQLREALTYWERYANSAFELYGRKVKFIFREGPGGANPADAQADAAAIATEDKAFFVICQLCTPPLHDELWRRGIPSTTLVVNFLAEYHQEKAPLVFGGSPDFDLVAGAGAEYYCKRLHGRNAVHAGDNTLRNTSRKLGIIAVDSREDLGERYRRLVESCGGQVGKVVKYTPDAATALTQASTAMDEMIAAGVTTITCVCDPITPINMTGAAEEKRYNPEWFVNGLNGQDAPGPARLYNRAQWSRAFGVSVFGRNLPFDQEEWYRWYKAGGGADEDTIKAVGGSIHGGISLIVHALEATGPNLTVANLANTILSAPPRRSNLDDKYGIRMSFGRNGPGPWTQNDDLMEVWWNPNGRTENGSLGAYFKVGGGVRHLNGEWPRTDPVVFVNDGSPQ